MPSRLTAGIAQSIAAMPTRTNTTRVTHTCSSSEARFCSRLICANNARRSPSAAICVATRSLSV
jgi:hypothetical protein